MRRIRMQILRGNKSELSIIISKITLYPGWQNHVEVEKIILKIAKIVFEEF